MISLLLAAAYADEVVYDDALGPLWYSWSWFPGSYDFTETSRVHSGSTSIYAGLGGYGGLSLYREGGFWEYSALRFWIEGDDPPVAIRFEDTTLGVRADDIPMSTLAILKSGVWTEITISLDALPAGGWNRVSWVDTSGTGAVIYVDDIELLDRFDFPTPFTSAEPLGTDRILLRGNDGDVSVTHDGRPVDVVDTRIEGAPTRTYVQLGEPLSAGTWAVTAGGTKFTRTVNAVTVTVGTAPTHTIDSAIYGANFPDWTPTEATLDRYGYTFVRWGGNARARYNPFARTTNLGSDWYFHNQLVSPSAENWVSPIDRSVDTMITVPNLDWVADDSEFWAYSVDVYGEQQAVAPDNPDAGNGVLVDGTPITWNDPSDGSNPWTPADAFEWLDGFGPVLPDWATIGNETDIAHLTHRPVVPSPSTYEDQRDRFLSYAAAVKDAQPNVLVSGPASCCWYFYWNSGVPGDHAALGDFLPWFLDEVAAADSVSGRRTLDALDVHYYPEGLIANGWLHLTDPETNRWRLTATRSLWDPTFVDDSWVGAGAPVTDQPEPHVVQLLPRLRALIDEHYPGTRLALSEWSFGGETHLSGGLATADALGLFGAYDLDMAMIWPAPAPATPTASAYELIRTGDLTFGTRSLPVTGGDPDVVGVYAAEHDDGRVTLLLVNKDPDVDQIVTLNGVPHGLLRVEHFGGALVDRITEDPSESFAGSLVVPAYSALLAQVVPETEPTLPPVPTVPVDTGTAPDDTAVVPLPVDRRCGCASGTAGAAFAPWWLAPLGLLRRRRPA